MKKLLCLTLCLFLLAGMLVAGGSTSVENDTEATETEENAGGGNRNKNDKNDEGNNSEKPLSAGTYYGVCLDEVDIVRYEIDDKGRLTVIDQLDYDGLIPQRYEGFSWLRFDYGEDGRIVGFWNANAGTEIAYDKQGNPICLNEELADRTLGFAYHPNGSIAQLTVEKTGFFSSMSFDSQGRMLSSRMEYNGRTYHTVAEYLEDGVVTVTETKVGGSNSPVADPSITETSVWYFSFDEQGRPIAYESVRESFPRAKYWTWNGELLVAYEDWIGFRETENDEPQWEVTEYEYLYDENGNFLGKTRTASDGTVTRYDQDGNQIEA